MTTPTDSPSSGPSTSTGPTFTAPPPPPPSGGPTGSAAPATSGPSIWEQIGRLGVRRDRNDGWFGGVCAGIAHRLGVDPLLIRALAIVLAIAGGFGVVAYLIAWLILPDADGKILLRDVAQGNVTGIVLVIALAFLLFSGISFGNGTWLGGWFVPLAALAILFLVLKNRRTDGQQPTAPGTSAGPGTYTGTHPYPTQATAPTGTQPYPPSQPIGQTTAYAAPAAYAQPAAPSGAGSTVPPIPPAPKTYGPPRPQRRRAPRGSGFIVFGLAVLGYGLGHLLAGPLQFNGSGNFLGLLIALGVAALAAIGLGVSGRRGGLASVLTLLLLFPVAGAAVVEKAPLMAEQAQTVTWTPTNTSGFNLGAGTATLDLSSLTTNLEEHVTTPVDITASVGVGQLIVLVPDDVELSTRNSVGLGSIDPGPFDDGSVRRTDAIGASQAYVITTGTSDTKTQIILNASVGLGDLTFQEK